MLEYLTEEGSPEHIRELHPRACEWHAENGLAAEAVSHALATPDLERAAGLIEHHSLAMVTRGELATLLGWIDALSDCAWPKTDRRTLHAR